MEDTAIIRLFQERSQQAIAELSQKYGKLCQSLSRRILNNEEDADPESAGLLCLQDYPQSVRQKAAA